ncbi:hypothetical protein ACIRU3_40430 [Streptomyces sp. NPDC101151]|uniref:hypothetical protein n=1 Tax=Streptomyces sp. NPDC101151 TaxID=3366115 RepID=UPI0037FAE412
MQRRKITIVAAFAIAAAAALTVWLLVRPSYDDVVQCCQQALAAQYKTDRKGKPAACGDVKVDDYDALVLEAAMDHLGWTDENGEFDETKMLDSVTETP